MNIYRLTEIGIKIGYEGEDLRKFVSEQQQEERKERAIAREEKRRQDELELRRRELDIEEKKLSMKVKAEHIMKASMLMLLNFLFLMKTKMI